MPTMGAPAAAAGPLCIGEDSAGGNNAAPQECRSISIGRRGRRRVPVSRLIQVSWPAGAPLSRQLLSVRAAGGVSVPPAGRPAVTGDGHDRILIADRIKHRLMQHRRTADTSMAAEHGSTPPRDRPAAEDGTAPKLATLHHPAPSAVTRNCAENHRVVPSHENLQSELERKWRKGTNSHPTFVKLH